MRDLQEINEKLGQLAEFAKKVNGKDDVAKEQANCQIDMLLWVLGGAGGWVPIDERYTIED